MNGREVVALGNPRIEALHQVGKLYKPGGGAGSRIFDTVMSTVILTPLSGGLFQGPGLRVVVHGVIVQSKDS